jgi:hypothetical protein
MSLYEIAGNRSLNLESAPDGPKSFSADKANMQVRASLQRENLRTSKVTRDLNCPASSIAERSNSEGGLIVYHADILAGYGFHECLGARAFRSRFLNCALLLAAAQ